MTAELSCYTANLVALLESEVPDVRGRLAHAVRLRVRADGVPGFCHHDRFDTLPGGQELGYRAADSWAAAREGLRGELREAAAVLAVGNTRYLPWSPNHGVADVPHWLLLHGLHDGRWEVRDDFQALLPRGEQLPYRGRMSDDELRRALSPPGTLPPEVSARDTYALGHPVPTPSAARYRWLARQQARPPAPRPGRWLDDPAEALCYLADRFSADPAALARHVDDLWAVARHQRHRLLRLTEDGAVPPAPAEAAARGWAALPRTLRFAADSAARGNPRPGLVARAFGELTATMTTAIREVR
ncbi:hypothetical protein [Catenuloplanes indicus]|uniref:Uncharacterized protein n=1 Tax=Catenuloplanes indicus TaxID=137267 RepID=A0AAE4AWD2_9ACTN|nr:hypothetical protein [Catenuloplanes indicus]MDQ0364909.1 hypothetical protein [Catenuloplanes indicus]